MKLGFLKMNQTTQTMYFYKFLKIYLHLSYPLSIFVKPLLKKQTKSQTKEEDKINE